ncbi:MAG: biopolymer transporter ExbD [Planctomycetes bacterium]|nr:biopolymer transporter ExbD [Planctomycetota bacterium]
MPFINTSHFRRLGRSGSFNMTPIIDIVFLLIIFFLVVCQFIEAENFPVNVPDNCDYAQSATESKSGLTTVTVMKTDDDGVGFAVGSQRVTAASRLALVEKLAGLIDVRLKDSPIDAKIVTLRIDKDIYFSDAQYALAAVAASNATDVQLATMKQKRPDLQ